MATHSSILAWKIPWTEEPGRLQSTGSQKESYTTEQLHFHFGFFAVVVAVFIIIIYFFGFFFHLFLLVGG